MNSSNIVRIGANTLMRKVSATSSNKTINDLLHLGTLLHTNSDFAPSALEDVFRALKVVDEGEILGTAAFLRRCLTLDPKQRPSAQELLKDGWLL